MKLLDAMAAGNVDAWVPWMQALSARMQRDLEKNEALLVDIQKAVGDADAVKLGALLAESRKLSPDEELEALVAAVGMYGELFGKPLAPAPEKQPYPELANLPEIEILKESSKVAKHFDECGGDLGDHPMKKVLMPYRKALDCADLLKVFSENADVRVKETSYTPLIGLRSMRSDPRFSKLSGEKHPIIAKAYSRLLDIEKSLDGKATKMNGLITKGDAALKDRKWTEASRNYRQALAIEDWPEIRDLAVKAEKNLSGL
jgi:hypothetical protein